VQLDVVSFEIGGSFVDLGLEMEVPCHHVPD
jgi:hypothetical protein